MSTHFQLPGNVQLTITRAVLQAMADHAQRDRKAAEAGGILIGHEPTATRCLIIDRMTPPQPSDRRSRCRYTRDPVAHQALLESEWAASGGRRTYLGEWHTHPEADPAPSWLDRRSNRRVMREADYDVPFLIFAIVGTRATRFWCSSAADPTMTLLGSVHTPETLGGHHDRS